MSRNLAWQDCAIAAKITVHPFFDELPTILFNELVRRSRSTPQSQLVGFASCWLLVVSRCRSHPLRLPHSPQYSGAITKTQIPTSSKHRAECRRIWDSTKERMDLGIWVLICDGCAVLDRAFDLWDSNF